MITIITISAIANIAQSIIAGWEYWVPPLIAVGIVMIWWIHIARKFEAGSRTMVYYVYASLLVFILVLGGIQMIILGILGEYIGRIFIEVKNRPLYIVEDKVNIDND